MRTYFISAVAILLMACNAKSVRNSYDSDLAPQSGMFFKNKPSAELFVADCRADAPLYKLSAMALQGLLNQDSAQVYLYLGDHHVAQLNDAERKFELLNPDKNQSGLNALLKKFADKVEKVYIWTPDQDWTWNMALMMASQNNGIALPKEIAQGVLDTMGWSGEVISFVDKWDNRESAYRWAIDSLLGNCNQTVLFSAGLRSDWKQAPWTIFDYAVASKGFTFWLDDMKTDEQNVIHDACIKGGYQPGSIVMGYAMSGDDLLKTVNGHGIGYVVSDYYANGSFWCSYPSRSFAQRKGEAKPVEANKVYVSIVFSDGDNLQFDQNALYEMWTKDTLRGAVPIGTTLAAGLQEINPFLLEWYYKHKSENDELMAGPSGFQFIYGEDYKDDSYDKWLELNRKWLASAGFSSACLWHTPYNTPKFDQYIAKSGMTIIFDGNDKAGLNVKDSVVIMNQGDHLWKEGELYYNLSRVEADSVKPVFINVYPIAAAYGAGGGVARLKREIDSLERAFPGKYEYMLPMDLAASILEYNNKQK